MRAGGIGQKQLCAVPGDRMTLGSGPTPNGTIAKHGMSVLFSHEHECFVLNSSMSVLFSTFCFPTFSRLVPKHKLISNQ